MSETKLAGLRDAARARSAVDHPGTIRSYYPFWDAQYRPYLLEAVESLPPERFDWKPRPEMLTARQTILHIAEAERWWIDHLMGGNPYEDYVPAHRDPAQGWETAYDAPDQAALLAVLAQWHRPTQRWFEQPSGELGRVFTYTAGEGVERRSTLHWILDHVQEHEIHHRAQLNLYLRMMGIAPPSI